MALDRRARVRGPAGKIVLGTLADAVVAGVALAMSGP